MLYYKNLFISVILSVLLLLVIMAVIMQTSKNKQIYPAVTQTCPDYYYMDGSMCIMNESIWAIRATESKQTTLSCNKANFTLLNNPGIGPSSAMCSKKKWASDCSVTWDGITNNSSICYN